MRKITFGGANSLDNYLARPDHAVDWLMWGDEVAAVMAEYWKTIDTVLMGRKTYEVALRSGPGGYRVKPGRAGGATALLDGPSDDPAPVAELDQAGHRGASPPRLPSHRFGGVPTQ